MASDNVERTATVRFFYNVCKIIYICTAPYYWCEQLKLPEKFIQFYNIFTKFINILMYVFIIMEIAAFYTQKHLTEKQSADRALFSLSHPILQLYCYILRHHEEKIRRLLRILTIELKEIFNDEEVEKQMIMKAKLFSGAYLFLFILTLFMYGINGLMGTTFTTIIPAWPDVEDHSSLAGFFRVVWYIVWWIFVIRVSTVYSFIIILTVCLSHQFKHVQSYFRSLDKIFDEACTREKEEEYETAFKVGIKLHSDTLWCTKEIQEICGVIFGGQILVNITVLVILMLQMVNAERTLSIIAGTALATIALLFSTGFLMWSAGDVTVEAAQLPIAMFASGWHHCRRDASKRIRALVVIAMLRSQMPVELECLGIVKLSYSAYVTIVKSSYSVFSVLYST